MISPYDNYIISAIRDLPETQVEFLQLKKKLSKEFKLPIPTNADLRDLYNKLLKKKKINRSEKFEKLLLSRAIRTESGVAVVAVLTKSFPCPGKCIYCPTEKNMPKSYLSNEPAVMRAIDAKFNPYRQMQNRLRSLELNGHATDKIELIVMGGTFSYLPKNYQKKFITECFRAANDYPNKVRKVSKVHKVIKSLNGKLLSEQKGNEKAKHRIVGLTLETRPDYIDKKEITNFRNLGCTRVELGVQSIFNDVLKKNKRGHNIISTIRATKMLKDAGFKLNYHMMPGLPKSSLKRDFSMFKELFSNPNFQPDMLKIYPTVVLKNSQLFKMWKNGLYKPLSDKQFEKLVLKIKNEVIPPYVRIARLVRDVPTSSIIAGPTVSNLRQIIIPRSHCPCIRCREVRNGYEIKDLPAMFRPSQKKDNLKSSLKQTKKVLSDSDIAMQAGKIVLNRIDYDASDGKEIFLQYVSENKKKLFALLRLRVTSENKAIIREVHTYGKMAKINQQDKKSPQHIGLGKKLIMEAEKIAKKEFGLHPHTKNKTSYKNSTNKAADFGVGVNEITVISGVGVREYYRKLGYRQKDTYMVKNL